MIAILISVLLAATMVSGYSEMFTYTTRNGWGAKEPKEVEFINGPVPYVVIHHTYIPPACNTTIECIHAMQMIQSMHQVTNGWNDIGYTFAVGGDGNIYQGRGFQVVGAHSPKYNDKSVGITLIGDWRYELPSEKMLDATKQLIDFGVKNGFIEEEYVLLGHRQVRDTECPGDALFNEISKWPHFDSAPRKKEVPSKSG